MNRFQLPPPDRDYAREAEIAQTKAEMRAEFAKGDEQDKAEQREIFDKVLFRLNEIKT